LREAQAKESDGMQPKRNQLEHIQALIEQAEKEADEIAEVLTRMRGLVAARLEQQANEVDRRYQALLSRQAELRDALTSELTDDNISNLLVFRETVAAGLVNPTFEDKRRWLEILQVEVRVENHQAVIACRLSMEPFAFNLDSSNNPAGYAKDGRFKFHIC